MTPDDRARVREIVARSCAEQGVPLTVPPDAASAVAAMVAAGPRRRRRSSARATADVLVAVVARAGEADASPAPE